MNKIFDIGPKAIALLSFANLALTVIIFAVAVARPMTPGLSSMGGGRIDPVLPIDPNAVSASRLSRLRRSPLHGEIRRRN